MKIAILRIGPVDVDIVDKIQNALCTVFPETTCVILEGAMPTPQEAYNASTRQYYSTRVLWRTIEFFKEPTMDRILGIIDLDLYVPQLNFVFGEAQCPGKAAIISLFRLKPEFYGQPPNRELFIERSIKEAVHEIGHTLGLGHCTNPSCVMFFSNSILDTDQKKAAFCEKCYPIVEKTTKDVSSKS